MTKTHKLRNNKKISKNKKLKKMKGGLLESHGLPECNMLSQFFISNDNINNFSRHFQSPMDCFINAMQIMNVVDAKSANIMRISTLGKTGFTKEQIELIFIYTYGNNFDFKKTNDYNEWSTWIATYLQPSHIVFAGYTNHVFLIGRLLDNTIVYIDPQVQQLCNLNDPTCSQYVQNQKEWYLLFMSQEFLTEEQKQLVVKYVEHLQITSI
jgi:hypothetical protein